MTETTKILTLFTHDVVTVSDHFRNKMLENSHRKLERVDVQGNHTEFFFSGGEHVPECEFRNVR